MELHEDPIQTAKAVQRQAGDQDQEGPAGAADHQLLQLQRLAGNAAVTQLVQEDDGTLVKRATSGGGSSIEPVLRTQMEAAMGQDFGDVRVHTGPDAGVSAQRLGANAYTVGNDVVFAPGRFDPDSASGRRTLAHELTHVVQQRSGPVEGAETGTGVKVSDPGDRFERAADATADQVMAGLPGDATAQTGSVPGVQREPMPEEEELPP